MVVGKKAKIGRRAPDETISLREKDRLVNMATKLIVATVCRLLHVTYLTC